jgi:hypothetical protein
MGKPYKNPNQYPRQIKITLSKDEGLIAETIGNGDNEQGIRVALMWARHFHNVGLRLDDPIDCIGLCLMADNDID